jgi:hypothetical protein
MSEDIDSQIDQKEKTLLPLCTHMEEYKNRFIEKTIEFTSEWYRKTTKNYVSKYPEVTLNMREEKIVQMKAQVNQLILDTEKIVRAELEQPELWWHLRPRLHDSIDQYLQVGDKPPEILDRAVRHVLGRLGLIFEDYKFNVSARGISGSYKEFWFEHPPGNESVYVPSYPHLLAWSQKMQDAIRDYNMEYVEANAIFVEVQKLKQEKKRQQAVSRWDNI